MRLNNCLLYAVLLAFSPSPLHAQNNGPYSGELRGILEEMKDTKNMMYEYTLTAKYPNDQTDRMEGVACIVNDSKLMYNGSNAMTVIYDGRWFYRANHREHYVSIVNVNKHLNKSYKVALEKDLFENNSLKMYLDSVIFQYGTVNKLKVVNDTLFMEIKFPKQMMLKSIDLVFDRKEKRMVRFATSTYKKWKNDAYGKNKGTTQRIECYNFRKADNSLYKMSNFFTVNNDKAILKKYTEYKLNSKL